MKKLFLICLLVLISFSFTTIKELPSPKPNGPGLPPGTPIDGGLSILLIVGTAYGVYKLRKKE